MFSKLLITFIAIIILNIPMGFAGPDINLPVLPDFDGAIHRKINVDFPTANANPVPRPFPALEKQAPLTMPAANMQTKSLDIPIDGFGLNEIQEYLRLFDAPYKLELDYSFVATTAEAIKARNTFLIKKAKERLTKERLYEITRFLKLNYKNQILAAEYDGANVDESNQHLPILLKQSQLNQFLFEATADGEIDLLRNCLDHILDINIKNKDGDNLLIYAINHNQLEVVRLLLARGIDFNVANDEGKTPLHIATILARPQIMIALLTYGADYKKKDDLGLSTEDYAVVSPNLSVVTALESFSKK